MSCSAPCSPEHGVLDRDPRGAPLQQGEAARCVAPSVHSSLLSCADFRAHSAANGDRMEAELAAALQSEHREWPDALRGLWRKHRLTQFHPVQRTDERVLDVALAGVRDPEEQRRRGRVARWIAFRCLVSWGYASVSEIYVSRCKATSRCTVFFSCVCFWLLYLS